MPLHVAELSIEGAGRLFGLIWLRVAPPALLVPSLGLGAPLGAAGLLLSFAVAFALFPFVLASSDVVVAPPPLMAAALSELLRGIALGLGCALPLWVFSSSGAISDALLRTAPNLVPNGSSPLATLYGGAALVAAAALAFQAGFGQVLFGALLDAPFGAAVPPFDDTRALFLDSTWLVLRAFSIGVALSAPMLLASFALTLVLGLVSLLGSGVARVVSPATLWPYVGLGAACLTALALLERVPQVASTFLRETGRLLGRLH